LIVNALADINQNYKLFSLNKTSELIAPIFGTLRQSSHEICQSWSDNMFYHQTTVVSVVLWETEVAQLTYLHRQTIMSSIVGY